MTAFPFTLAVEGETDAALARRLLQEMGLPAGPVYGLRGKYDLDENLLRYNHAAKHSPWLILRDLDQDAACAPEFIREKLPQPSRLMCFRIVVRTAEAWFLADREKMSSYLGIPRSKIPANPDYIADPKSLLVALARSSRKKTLRSDMVPLSETSARVGPAYTVRLIEFASQLWRPRIAAKQSISLQKCLKALEKLADYCQSRSGPIEE